MTRAAATPAGDVVYLGSCVGNRNAHDLGSAMVLRALPHALGTERRYSASSVVQLPKLQVQCGFEAGESEIAPLRACQAWPTGKHANAIQCGCLERSST